MGPGSVVPKGLQGGGRDPRDRGGRSAGQVSQRPSQQIRELRVGPRLFQDAVGGLRGRARIVPEVHQGRDEILARLGPCPLTHPGSKSAEVLDSVGEIEDDPLGRLPADTGHGRQPWRVTTPVRRE